MDIVKDIQSFLHELGRCLVRDSGAEIDFSLSPPVRKDENACVLLLRAKDAAHIGVFPKKVQEALAWRNGRAAVQVEGIMTDTTFHVVFRYCLDVDFPFRAWDGTVASMRISSDRFAELVGSEEAIINYARERYASLRTVIEARNGAGNEQERPGCSPCAS